MTEQQFELNSELRTESCSWVELCAWADETGWAVRATLPDAMQVAPTAQSAYPRWCRKGVGLDGTEGSASLKHPHRTPWVPEGTEKRCVGSHCVPEPRSLGRWQDGSWARVRRQHVAHCRPAYLKTRRKRKLLFLWESGFHWPLGQQRNRNKILTADRASMAVNSGSGVAVATTPEGASPAEPSSSEDVSPSPDAAIDILSSVSAPNEMLAAPSDEPAKSPGNREGRSLREE